MEKIKSKKNKSKEKAFQSETVKKSAPEQNEVPIKDRFYVLTDEMQPLTYMLASRNTRRFPLMHFDGKVNRALRYARNQKSPFEDEQDGNAILEPIMFEDGSLHVPANNPVLQQFLELHPLNGKAFKEVDNSLDAKVEMDTLNYEVDALIAARDLEIGMVESIARVYLGQNVETVSNAELKRDVLVFAKTQPKDFLNALDDPMLRLQNTAAKFFSESLVILKNNNKDICFNLKGNKNKILTVPYGEQPVYILASYLQSDEGIETLKMLEKKLKD